MTAGLEIEIRNQDFNDYEVAGGTGTNTVEISESGVIEIDGDEHDTDRTAHDQELSRNSIVVDSQ